MGNCRSKSNPANGPSEPQKLPESNHNEDQRKAEEKQAEPRTPHGFQQQSKNREEEHGARERGHAGENGRPRELQAARQRSEKDRRQTEEKVLICIGPPGSGKSQFIDSLTQQTNWAGGSLKPQKHGVRHVELKNSDLPGTVILLDTPGFDDPYKPVIDVIKEVEGWLQCERKQNQVAGVLYFHNITDTRLTVRPPFQYLKKLCGNNPKKVFFVTTHWDRARELRKWDCKETELRNGQWKPFLDSGAQATRFDKTTITARQIVQMVLSSSSA